MRLEQNELSLLFSNTSLPDVFITEYLSEAPGDYIKVYLYILFLSKYGKDIKLNDLSKKIALPLPTIQAAIKYWEDVEVITKKGTGYIVNNIQEVELNKLYSPKITVSKESVQNMQKDKSRSSAIEAINNSFFQGIMSPSWYGDIDLWFKKFEFDEESLGISQQKYEDYRSKYLGIYDRVRNSEKTSILADIDFGIELMHTDKINVSYILNLIRTIDFSNEDKIKKDVVKIRRLLDKADNDDLRLKSDLIREFLEKVVPKAGKNDSVDELFNDFMEEKSDAEVNEIAQEVNVEKDMIKGFINEYEYSGKIDGLKIKENLKGGFLVKKKLADKIKNFIVSHVKKFTF